MGRVVKLEEIVKISEELKNNNKTVVTTNGCFDILHVGHVRYLQQARQLGDVLILGLNSDDSVRRLKGPTRPVNNESDRAEVMTALNCIDYVVIFKEDTPVNLLSAIKPNIHAKGGDYDLNTLPEAEVIMQNGGEVKFISLVEGKSTTNIIAKAKS